MTEPKLTLAGIKAMKNVALTRTDVADALGIDPRTVTAGIEDGTIPSVKIGRRVLIPRIPFLKLFGAMEGTDDD